MDTPESPPSEKSGPSEKGEPAEPAAALEVTDSKTERIAGMRHELADVQRQLLEAQQKITTELQGRAEDADRFEELENLMQEQRGKAATQVAELTGERDSLKSFLESANTAMEEVRRDLAAREARIEESAKQSRELSSETSSLRERLAAREADLATRTSERDAEKATQERLEWELAEQRAATTSEREAHKATQTRLVRELEGALGKHRELTERLEKQETSLAEAKTHLAERDAELVTRSSERDALQATKLRLEDDLEEARRALDERNTRAQALARQLTSLGQELLGSPPPPGATTPPPLPGSPRRRHANTSKEIEIIEERPAVAAKESSAVVTTKESAAVTIKPAPARSPGRGLALVLSGVAVGAVCSLAIGRLREPGGTAAGKPQEGIEAAGPLSDTAPGSEHSTDPEVAASALPDPAVPSVTPAPLPSNTGIIALPARADGRRVFVDGRLVEVKDRRVQVPCGKHEIQIGSRGTPRPLDVACGGETEVP